MPRLAPACCPPGQLRFSCSDGFFPPLICYSLNKTGPESGGVLQPSAQRGLAGCSRALAGRYQLKQLLTIFDVAGLLTLWIASLGIGMSQTPPKPADIDSQVRKFLESRRGSWHDLNVPEADGREMFNIIVEHGYKNSLEIGTSTGHSGIWIAWALSKTGGKLITIDIDPDRHRQALANFKAAGVSAFIDARLGDAHELVPALQGPFDFVFSDADKDWYINYVKAILPKLAPAGCLVTHNVSERGWGANAGYLQFLRSQPSLETTVFSRGGGMSISYKRAPKAAQRMHGTGDRQF
jgi:caffeoyl-CoA O-methyltransferase